MSNVTDSMVFFLFFFFFGDGRLTTFITCAVNGTTHFEWNVPYMVPFEISAMNIMELKYLGRCVSNYLPTGR